VALAVLAMLATGVTLLVWLGDLTFWRDEWGFLLHRRGFSADVFLQPHYEHIAISLIASYKLLLAIFGMDSPRPFQVVAVGAFITSLALVFVYVRRRVGDWLALASILPILVLGAAWDDLLWPFQLGFFGTVCAGMGGLLALERDDRPGDLAACALFVMSISFSSLGVPFAIGAAVMVGLDPRRRQRAFVALVPIAVYALWWLGYGRHADSSASLSNLATSPSYVLDGFASSLSSLLGFATPSSVVLSPLDWGRALLVVFVVLSVWRARRADVRGRGLYAVLAIAGSFWLLAALNASVFRAATAGRYQYMGAIFIVLIAAELLRGVRVERWVRWTVLAVSALAALSNVSYLHTSWRGLTQFGELQPADLAVLEITRDTVDPAFQLTEQNSGVDYLGFLDAGSYFSAVDAFGSPADTPEELAAASEHVRVVADRLFASALELKLVPVPVPADPASRCTTIALGREPRGYVPTGAATTFAAARGASVAVDARRYSSASFPAKLGTVTGGSAVTLTIPADHSSQPWKFGLTGSGTVEVCPG
jgi:hypothetical protein